MVTRSQQRAAGKTGAGCWARGWECNASEGLWHTMAERQMRKVVLVKGYSISSLNLDRLRGYLLYTMISAHLYNDRTLRESHNRRRYG